MRRVMNFIVSVGLVCAGLYVLYGELLVRSRVFAVVISLSLVGLTRDPGWMRLRTGRPRPCR